MKKGNESGLTIVFSLFFLVIILTLFSVLFSQSAINKTDLATKEINLAELNINLINYLRTPIENGLTVQDLIVNSYYNNDYKKLDNITSNIFNKVYDKEKCPLWDVKGEIDKKEFFEYESEFDIRKYSLQQPPRNILTLFAKDKISPNSYTIEIVLPDKSKKAEITLTEGCLNE